MPLSPRKTLNLKALAQSAQTLVVIMCVTLAGCQTSNQYRPDSGRDTDRAVGLEQEPEWLNSGVAPAPEEPKDIWERVRNGYQLQDTITLNPRIEQQRLWFVSNPTLYPLHR